MVRRTNIALWRNVYLSRSEQEIENYLPRIQQLEENSWKIKETNFQDFAPHPQILKISKNANLITFKK